MQSLYQTRGYKALGNLLLLQTGGFLGLLAWALLMPDQATARSAGEWIPSSFTGFVALAIAAGFAGQTWSTLAESVSCLDIHYWKHFWKFALRPLLWMAPIAKIASDTLLHAGVSKPVAAVPLVAVSTAGALICLLFLSHVWAVRRVMSGNDGVKLEVLDELKSRHGDGPLQRLSDSLDYARGASDLNPFQMRRGLMLADLQSSAWYDRSRFPWAAEFESAFEQIRDEALRVCSAGSSVEYGYPGVAQGQWNVFWLINGAQVSLEAQVRCPATLDLLRKVPGFPTMREAHFSILQPRSRILPHCDNSNTWVTAHLGIQIPPETGIRVGRETRGWKEGEFIFFDTSYQHEAWNDSDSPRIILLFDFLHPDLSPAEREFFASTT